MLSIESIVKFFISCLNENLFAYVTDYLIPENRWGFLQVGCAIGFLSLQNKI